MPVEAVKIEGLKEVQKALKALDGESQKQLRLVFNEAAELVVARARPLVPTRSGRARGSIKAASGQREAKVKAGGARVPYYGWLDFGGSTGRKRTTRRKFLKDGRYIYPSYSRIRPQLIDVMEDGLSRLVREAGLLDG